jgi:hypothetical protein
VSDPEFIICTPINYKYQPRDDNLLGVIATYFHQILGGRRDQIQAQLPMVMPLCGKVRICHRGDSIRTVFAICRLTESYRDNTFVQVSLLLSFYHSRTYHLQYEIQYDTGKCIINVIGYGRLEKILLCTLDGRAVWGTH